MWTSASLTVHGQGPTEVLASVEKVLSTDRRFGKPQRLEYDRVIVADTLKSLTTSRRGIKIEALTTSDASHTDLELTSFSFPLFDWGANGRHVQKLAKALAAAGLEGELSDMKSTHKMGGPWP